MTTANTELAKWWTTESCRQAFARARRERDNKLAAMKARLQAKREQMEREANEWKVVA